MVAPSLRARVRAGMIEEIKAVARRHLATDGANLSLRAVARDLGMVSSAVYRYFPSRDDLLTALILESYDALGDAVETADADADRASRAAYQDLPPGGVVLVSGALLLGGALPFDLAVHLVLSPAALERRTEPVLRWTLPAFARYAAEVDPASFADVVVRVDDPRRPALVEAG
ncbi:TetR family transcriptional regulator [Micromonospora maritima]|uniref:TetR family transcriptional regulator n=1 Tax=Micromonospora maritima TaxID=986711 RepID=UPI00157C6B23|nr:TetR family transcriptional regulator [Micromonospora maritima]